MAMGDRPLRRAPPLPAAGPTRGPGLVGQAFDLVRRAWIPGAPMRRFVHENVGFELTWIEQGSVRFEAAGREIEAAAGSCLLLPPGIENTPTDWHAVAHQITLAGPLVEEAADALGPAGQVPTAAVVLPAEQRLTTLARLLVRDAGEGIAPEDPGLVALVNALCFALARGEDAPARQRRPDHRIRRALDRIAEDFAADLSIDALAQDAGMSRFAFLRTFRAQTGESPYQHLLAVRLAHAANLLATPAGAGRSILEIAMACGFSDPGRFARRFRARYGRLPRAYRAAAR
jgi:AraC family transcriptional regulator